MPQLSTLLAQLKKRFVRNVITLYGIHFFNYLLPLITIPYLSRTLGVESWGRYVFVQALAIFLYQVMEYNAPISGTRSAAQLRENPQARGELIASIFGAKAIVVLVVFAVMFLVRPFIGSVASAGILLWWGLAWSGVQSFNLIWYFIGIERVATIALVDVLTRIVVTVGIFVFVRTPDSIYLIFLLQAFASLVSNCVGYWIALRDVPLIFPSMRLAVKGIKEGFQLFISLQAFYFYSSSSTILVGLLSSPVIVGIFSGADKLNRAAIGLTGPFSQAFYPKLVRAVQEGREESGSAFRKGFYSLLGAALLGTAILFFGAPLIIRIILGSNFGDSVGVLRVICLLIPLTTITMMLGRQWMLVQKRDSAFNVIQIIVAVAMVVAAVLVVPVHGALGMAWVAVIVESFNLLLMFSYLRWKQVQPDFFGSSTLS